MVGGLGAHCRDDPGAPPRQGRGGGGGGVGGGVGWGVWALGFWVVYALLERALAWRVLFWIGVLPAFLILYIRRNISDPEVYHQTRARMAQEGDKGNFLEIFSPQLLKTTILAGLL